MASAFCDKGKLAEAQAAPGKKNHSKSFDSPGSVDQRGALEIEEEKIA